VTLFLSCPSRRLERWLHAFLTSATDGGGQLHAPAGLPHPQGKSPWYSLDWRLGGPQIQSGHGGKEKQIPAPAWDRTLVIKPAA